MLPLGRVSCPQRVRARLGVVSEAAGTPQNVTVAAWAVERGQGDSKSPSGRVDSSQRG